MISPETGLDWVDGFIDRIRPYVFVRESDGVLIRMPNEAFKLNSSGAAILARLLETGGIREILAARDGDSGFAEELRIFFENLSVVLGGRYCEEFVSGAIEKVAFRLGYIELPVLSEIALTYRCNIRCRFCYAACRQDERRRVRDRSSEMNTQSVRRVLRKIRFEGEVPSVSFTGGEPLLRRDLPDLIRFASRKLGMRVNLITNATMIDDRTARNLHRSGLASAQVSIEAPEAALHDRIVGSSGAFSRSVAGLQALNRAGIFVHPHITICSLNQDFAPRMARFSRSLGMSRFSANLVIPAGRGSDRDLQVSYERIGPILNRIQQEAEREGVKFMWYSPTPLCLFNPIANQLGNKGCSACEGLLSVDPRGNVLPCSSWPEPLGNLLDLPFRDIWFSERAVSLRRKQAAHIQCRTCVHFPVCHGACPLYFQVNGYRELEFQFNRMKQEVPA
ncbi:radical SAM protein [bacterium]|nr:radical SAM protein [candidate division CSSED10-310 bacterium]